jgi:hypothetical protein
MTKKCAIGVDGMTFELLINGAGEHTYLATTPLLNNNGREFGSVSIENSKIYVYLNLPKLVRHDNVTPFSLADMFMLESLKDGIKQAFKRVLKDIDVFSASVKTIECNITRPVAGKSNCSQVLNLINRSFHEGTNVVYQRASSKCKYDKENETVVIRKKNCYALKCYDKSLEQRKLGRSQVEDGLLRIEIVIQNRLLNCKRLFAGKCTMQEMLNKARPNKNH